MITFAYYTGVRRGELLVICWTQVDFGERIVRLEPGETKNDEPRHVPLYGELYDMLLLEKERRDAYYPDSPWVFSRDGDRIRDFRGAWDEACKRAGLWDPSLGKNGRPWRLFHDLRRTGVRNLIRAGVPERIAMEISGHKTRAMFDRYNIVTPRDIREAGHRMELYLEQQQRAATTEPKGPVQ